MSEHSVQRGTGFAGYRARIYEQYVTAKPRVSYSKPEEAPAGLTDFLRHVVRRHFPENKVARVLDIGCGHGLLVHFARESGWKDVAGIDISPQQVALAQSMGIHGVQQGDGFETLLKLQPESHDAILAMDVLEHVTKAEVLALADAVYRVLKPGGRWIIHTVNAESPFFGQVRYGDLTHEQAFTRTSINQLAAVAGFSQVMCYEDRPVPRRFGGALRWLAWHVARAAFLPFLISEAGGAARHTLMSRNFLAVAIK